MDEKSTNLINWFNNNGGILDNLLIVYTNEMGYDIQLNQPDQPFHLTIPPSLILSSKKCIEGADSTLKIWFETIGDQFGDIESIPAKLVLKLFLIYQNLYPGLSQSIDWSPYVDMLPTEFSSPICWSEEMQGALEGTSLQIPLKSQINSLYQQYSLIEQLDNISWDLWLWADRAVNSRVFEIPVNENEIEFAMIPMLDVFNHDETPNCYWEPHFFNDSNQTDHIPSIQIFPKETHFHIDSNQQRPIRLTFSYGRKSIDSWIFSHGFIPNDIEPETSITLPNIMLMSSSAFEKDEFREMKMHLMQLNELPPVNHYPLTSGIFDQVDILGQAYITQLAAEDRFTMDEFGQLVHPSYPQPIIDLNDLHELLLSEELELKYRKKFLNQLQLVINNNIQQIQLNMNNNNNQFLIDILQNQLNIFNKFNQVIDSDLNND